jgi:hypothetical protein
VFTGQRAAKRKRGRERKKNFIFVLRAHKVDFNNFSFEEAQPEEQPKSEKKSV